MIDAMELKRIDNIPSLMIWRKEVIENVFGIEPDSSLLEANREYYSHHIPDGTHIAFVAVEGETEMGCGGVCITEELPSPDNPTGKCGYLMNIYVRKPFRNKGVAHEIVRHLIRIAGEAQCGKIYLETTEDGRPVYASLGFEDMTGMMKLKS